MTTQPGPTEAQLDMVVQFGKPHRGWKVRDVPRDYMRWCVANYAQIPPEIKTAFEAVLGSPSIPVGSPRETVEVRRADYDAIQAEARRDKKTIDDLRRRLAAAEQAMKAQAQVVMRASAKADVEPIRVVARRWFGRVSRKYHPDLGGSAEAQTIVNACYQELQAIIEEQSQ